ncbi:hypothetical protein HU175_14080 [Spirosoma sp. KUDC1026]|nr:hypothetical protein HU175_14080 [Spirosoma sp. KUDC1026]
MALLAALTAGLAIWVVGKFSHPLSDGNDTDQFEYVGYFFGKNLSFWPFPRLNLINNQTFYPYGTNNVFLDWGFERDYWYTFCSKLFGGPGPYLQPYYVYSLTITAVGTYWLLRPLSGSLRAFLAGLILSVFNFYALYKFPVHMNVCVGHWTVLCIVATYRLLWMMLHRQAVSLPYALGWVWLHVLVLGQELGYVAGFALTFTTLTIPVAAVALYQWGKLLPNWRHAFGHYVHEEYQTRKAVSWLLLGCILFTLWLYVPLTLQIAFTAWRADYGAVPETRAWSHPVRLLLPYLPGLDSFAMSYQHWLHDTFESYGQGSPGLYLVVLGAVGLWQTHRSVLLWLPVVLMLLLCLSYHPILFPTLKLFPWFSFNRHGGRASLIYPVLFTLLALPVRWSDSRNARWAVCCLGLLMLTEWTHGLRTRLQIPLDTVSDDVLRYCATIRRQPGVAVLDFPFCTVGADGVGAPEGLCPYYDQQNAIFTFRRFYDKSGVGQYFGRLPPAEIQPFLRDGWPRLLAPGRTFTAQDWQFLDRFLRQNDFAGINLYPDLLTPAQLAGFYQRYGPPIAETRFPAAGRVVFIPVHSKASTGNN